MRAEMIVQADVTAAIMGLKRIEDNMVQIARKQKLVSKEARSWGGRIKTAATHLASAYATFKVISVVSNAITGSIRSWNEALAESRRKLGGVQSATREYLAMVPTKQRTFERARLQRWARVSPLTLEEVGPIAASVRSMLPPSTGVGAAERQIIERAAGAEQLLRGAEGTQIAAVLGKSRGMFKGTTSTQWANMVDRMLVESGFTGEQLKEFMQQLPKAGGPGAIAQADPALILAMATLGSRQAGSPSRAQRGVGMMIQRLYEPAMARKLGIRKAEYGEMGLEARLGAARDALMAVPEGQRLTMAETIFGKRAGPRAAGLMQNWTGVETEWGELTRVGAIKHLVVEQKLQAAAAADPEFYHWLMQRTQDELVELKKVHPRRVMSATLQARRVALAEEITGAGPGGALKRGQMKAMYMGMYATSFGDEAAATEDWLDYLAGEQGMIRSDRRVDVHGRWEALGKLNLSTSGGPQVPRVNGPGAELDITVDPIE